MKSFVFGTKQELLENIANNPNAGYVVFTDCSMVAEIAEKVDERVIVCSGSGEFTPAGFQEKAITGFTYEKETVEVVEILYPPLRVLNKFKEAYNKIKNNPNAFALLLCDGLSAMEEAIVTTFYFTDPSFKVIGGSAGDGLAFKETPIYIGSRKVFSVALFVNARTKTQIIKENLYTTVPEKRMLVTSADPMNRIVRTLNDKPAATEYARQLNVSESELSKYFISNPLGRTIMGETLISSPMKINSDKSITFYCQIMPNMFVDLLELADYRSVIQDTKKQIMLKPSFAISINCILRSLYFQGAGLWKTVDRELLSICPDQTGFISYGEQFHQNHFNQTMVMLLVE